MLALAAWARTRMIASSCIVAHPTRSNHKYFWSMPWWDPLLLVPKMTLYCRVCPFVLAQRNVSPFVSYRELVSPFVRCRELHFCNWITAAPFCTSSIPFPGQYVLVVETCFLPKSESNFQFLSLFKFTDCALLTSNQNFRPLWRRSAEHQILSSHLHNIPTLPQRHTANLSEACESACILLFCICHISNLFGSNCFSFFFNSIKMKQ